MSIQNANQCTIYKDPHDLPNKAIKKICENRAFKVAKINCIHLPGGFIKGWGGRQTVWLGDKFCPAGLTIWWKVFFYKGVLISSTYIFARL